jgi:hypothetical protein
LAHLYEGVPDGRQASEGEELSVSRFRPRYRALSEAEKSIHDEVKDAFAAAEKQIERIKPGRYRSLALTALEESCMWAIKELTR